MINLSKGHLFQLLTLSSQFVTVVQFDGSCLLCSYYKLGRRNYSRSVHAEMDPGQQSSSTAPPRRPLQRRRDAVVLQHQRKHGRVFPARQRARQGGTLGGNIQVRTRRSILTMAIAAAFIMVYVPPVFCSQSHFFRRFEALGHHRRPQELEARFGQYKPKRPRKKRKRAADQLEQQAQGGGGSSSAPPQPPDRREQQAQEERLARSRRVEEARKRLLDEIDLDAFFSEENSWKGAVIALKLGRSESELGE